MAGWIGACAVWLLGSGALEPAPRIADAAPRIELPTERAAAFEKVRLLVTGTPLVGLAAYASTGWNMGCSVGEACGTWQRSWPGAVGTLSLGTGLTMVASGVFSLSAKGRGSDFATRVAPVTKVTRFGTRTFGFELAF